MVAEGGNLGCTQRGRIEFALRGGLINTDAIDNSAGVDCSDHEVNIKIALDAVVADGELTPKQRDKLLAEMTDDVAALVLRDNTFQNQVLLYSRSAQRRAARRTGPLHAPPVAPRPAEPAHRVPARRRRARRSAARPAAG